MNNDFWKIIISICVILIISSLFVGTIRNHENKQELIKIEIFLTPSPQQEEEKEEEQIVYTKDYVNLREQPNTNCNIITTFNINTELIKIGDVNDEWSMISFNDNVYYINSKYLSNEKVNISNYTTGILTKSKGVNYFNGHKETWYSQRVLPGGGLIIPGRHVNEQGLICDEDGYICVASEDYPKGTIVETSLGTGKVYDCGCAKGTIDIYTDW